MHGMVVRGENEKLRCKEKNLDRVKEKVVNKKNSIFRYLAGLSKVGE